MTDYLEESRKLMPGKARSHWSLTESPQDKAVAHANKALKKLGFEAKVGTQGESGNVGVYEPGKDYPVATFAASKFGLMVAMSPPGYGKYRKLSNAMVRLASSFKESGETPPGRSRSHWSLEEDIAGAPGAFANSDAESLEEKAVPPAVKDILQRLRKMTRWDWVWESDRVSGKLYHVFQPHDRHFPDYSDDDRVQEFESRLAQTVVQLKRMGIASSIYDLGDAGEGLVITIPEQKGRKGAPATSPMWHHKASKVAELRNLARIVRKSADRLEKSDAEAARGLRDLAKAVERGQIKTVKQILRKLPQSAMRVIPMGVLDMPAAKAYESVAGAPGAFAISDAEPPSLEQMKADLLDRVRNPRWEYPSWALPKVALDEAISQAGRKVVTDAFRKLGVKKMPPVTHDEMGFWKGRGGFPGVYVTLRSDGEDFDWSIWMQGRGQVETDMVSVAKVRQAIQHIRKEIERGARRLQHFGKDVGLAIRDED